MSADWIRARDALEMLQPGCGSFSPSTADAICRNASAGRVKAMAKSFTVTGRGQPEQFVDRVIPQRFWQVGQEKQDWRHGNFVSVERGTDLQGCLDWEIRCEALDVAFLRADIEAMKGGNTVVSSTSCNGKPATSKPTRGRPVGSASYAPVDAILVEKMHEWKVENPGKSTTAAARIFVGEADGGGTEDTKIRRLVGRYRQAHPN